MTTPKKKHRWAMLPPAGAGDVVSPDDVTQTRRRIPKGKGSESGDAAVSRRRARTEPELPRLDELAQQVTPSAVRARGLPREFEALTPTNLSTSSREAATVPPDGSPTWASPALTESPQREAAAAVPTIVDLSSPTDESEVTIVERSTGANLRAKATSKSTAPHEHIETMPSPPGRDDEH